MDRSDIPPGFRAALDQDVHALLTAHAGMLCESGPTDPCPAHRAIYWALLTLMEDVRAAAVAVLPDREDVDLNDLAQTDPEAVVESVLAMAAQLAIWRAAIGSLVDEEPFAGLG